MVNKTRAEVANNQSWTFKIDVTQNCLKSCCLFSQTAIRRPNNDIFTSCVNEVLKAMHRMLFHLLNTCLGSDADQKVAEPETPGSLGHSGPEFGQNSPNRDWNKSAAMRPSINVLNKSFSPMWLLHKNWKKKKYYFKELWVLRLSTLLWCSGLCEEQGELTCSHVLLLTGAQESLPKMLLSNLYACAQFWTHG